MEEEKWIKMHFKELREKYPGKYIAILGNKIIASGTTAKKVLAEVKKKGIEHPRFMHIPKAKTVFY